jgi:hypothetical protein
LAVLGDQEVICVPSRAIPNALRELARLREVTFRAALARFARTHRRHVVLEDAA